MSQCASSISNCYCVVHCELYVEDDNYRRSYYHAGTHHCIHGLFWRAINAANFKSIYEAHGRIVILRQQQQAAEAALLRKHQEFRFREWQAG